MKKKKIANFIIDTCRFSLSAHFNFMYESLVFEECKASRPIFQTTQAVAHFFNIILYVNRIRFEFVIRYFGQQSIYLQDDECLQKRT